MPRVYIKTYGCQMNEHDSEQVSQMFIERGYSMTPTDADAETDVLLINTCSVRDQAERKALGKMGMVTRDELKVVERVKYAELVGQEVEILCEGPSETVATRLMGRTRTNKIVVFEGSAARHVGEIFKVRVHGFENFTLYADAILSD